MARLLNKVEISGYVLGLLRKSLGEILTDRGTITTNIHQSFEYISELTQCGGNYLWGIKGYLKENPKDKRVLNFLICGERYWKSISNIFKIIQVKLLTSSRNYNPSISDPIIKDLLIKITLAEVEERGFLAEVVAWRKTLSDSDWKRYYAEGARSK